MKNSFLAIVAITCMMFIFPTFLNDLEIETNVQSVEGRSQVPEWFVITGLVENPLNITYAELRNFPQVSEVTMLECAGSGGGVGWGVTYNWTGVPLFYLLSRAKVIPGTYREVVFDATDNFSSSVLLETAMHATTILALEANGTDLEQIGGFGSGYRVVFPCRWGYKWVKWINQITLVDYDYKGTYEQVGYSDEAIRPNCTMPSTDPPTQTFNATKFADGDPEEYFVQVLSNSSIESFSFESDNRMTFNVTGPEQTSGYFYVSFPKELLASPYQIYVDQNPAKYSQTDVDDHIYLFLTYNHSVVTIEIKGTLGTSPDINRDGKVDIRDIAIVAMAFGSNPGDPNWNATADVAEPYGEIDILDIAKVARDYGKTV